MPTLNEAAQAVGLEFGMAFAQSKRSTYPDAATVVVNECGLLVDEFSSNFQDWQPTQGVFSYTNFDLLNAWGVANGLRIVQGGHLIWHDGLPAWLTAITNPTTLRTILETHITTVMSRMGTTIMHWNVINEVIATWNGNPNLYRTSHWWSNLGDTFVKWAFDAAASVALPGQKLIWNDNHAIEDVSPAAFDANYAQLVRWLNAGVRIDGWGTQMHLTAPNASASVMVDRLNQIAGLGLDIYVTELDITDTPYTGTADSIKQQCADYTLAMLGPICRYVPRLKHITCWSPSDTTSWLNSYLGPRGDGIPRTGNCYDRSDPPQPNPMRQALIDAMLLRAPAPDVTGNVVDTLTNSRATITVATPSTAIEVRFGTDVLVDHNGLALTSPGRLTDETSATLDDESAVALFDNEANSLTGQTTTGSESVTLTLTGGT
jgi:endo-1,4-beta-xylanase